MKKLAFVLAVFAAAAFAEPAPVTIRVMGRYTRPNGFGVDYMENIIMPVVPGAVLGPDRKWTMKCDKELSAGGVVDGKNTGGLYMGTYDKEKNQLRIDATDLKSKAQTVKCQLTSHDWSQPVR
jgi:hypothetical protein